MKTVLLALLFPALLVVVLFGGLYVYARGHGFSAREQPGWMERTMALNVRKIATPADAKSLANPRQQQTAEMIVEADEHFVEHCSVCHGIDGRGDTNIGRNLYPKVPDSNSVMVNSITSSAMAFDLVECPPGVLKTSPKRFGIWLV
jgi:mono/diheme cytochrome c family protein